MTHCSRLFAIALLVLAVSTAFGQLLVQDDFNYPVGTDLSANGWSKGSSVPALGAMNVGATGLQFTGYIGSGVGNAALAVGFTERYSKSMPVPTSGNIYAAFMLRVDTATSAGGYVASFFSNNASRGRFWVKNDGTGKLKFGLSGKSASAPVTYDTATYAFKTTYLVVLKYLIVTTGTTDDRYALIVNPAPGKVEPAPNLGPLTDTGNDLGVNTSGSSFSIQGRDSTGAKGIVTIDGIRVSQNWADVVPPPPLYYKGTGTINDPANWGSNIDGSGTRPPDFASDNQLYIVGNTTAVSLSTQWIVTGVGSKVIVGAGVNLTVAAGGTLAATVDVNTGGTLTLTQSAFWPAFGDIGGIVSLNSAAGFALDADYTFPSGAGTYEMKSADINLSGRTLIVKGRLRTYGNKITGTGTFKLDSAATLYIYSPNGIVASGASGDIQSSVRQFSRYANYSFAGSSNQVTGDAIPDTVNNLTIQMANRTLTTSLSKFVAAAANLNLTTGKFKLGNINLWFNNPSGQSDSGYVITDGTGSLIRPVANTSRKTMPVGSATEYRPAFLTCVSTPTASNIAFRYVSGDAGSAGLPSGTTTYYKGGYWTITPDVAPGVNFKLELNASATGLDSTAFKILVRPNSTSAWQFAGVHPVFSSGVVTDSSISSFGQFAIGVGPKTTAVEEEEGLPRTYSLSNNYPNPFNPSTTVRFDLPVASRVSITVFNLLGQQVATLVDEERPAGSYAVSFNAAGLSSGLYFYQMKSGSFNETRKMLLTK